MEMKVQMHRFIIYAERVILIKQTKNDLVGKMQQCWIQDNIKHMRKSTEGGVASFSRNNL